MTPFTIPPELRPALDWLRTVNAQSWRAPAPPPAPARPVSDPHAQAFYDYLMPVFTQTAQVWAQLAPFRSTPTTYVPTAADYGGGAP